MRIARIGAGEGERLAAVSDYDLPEGEPDSGLGEVTDLAARLFDVPLALVTLVGETRQVFAGRTGTDLCGTDRDISFCSHALGGDDLLVVPDAVLDPRFADNPLVTEEPHVRFYAGAPLRTHAGHVLGTLCIIDHQPRSGLSARDRKSLRHLAALALHKLEHRRLAVAGQVGQQRFQSIAATSPDAIICADQQGRISFWNAAAERLFGYGATEALGSGLDLIVPPRLRGSQHAGQQRLFGADVSTLLGKTVELDGLHKSGREMPIELSLSMWREGAGTSFGAVMRDISERRANEDNLFHLAHCDALTGLPNRHVLFERIAERIGRTDPMHLLFVGLDGFKPVNDTAGHHVGDAVLKEAAARLVECARTSDTVARVGSDEFMVLMPARRGHDGLDADPERTADCLIAALTAPFRVDRQVIHLSASIGIASWPDHGTTAEELISAADLAMYQAKREGRRCRRMFSAWLREEALALRSREQELRRAIDRREFTLFYQPQVSLADGRLLGAEALIRWQHPEHGLLSPAAFLPAVEQGLLAVEVGTWVLETACAQAVSWRRQVPGFQMAVNLFEAQFGTGTLAAQIRSILDHSGLDPAGLELEVTENVILRHDTTMLDALRALHDEGVGISFDDFGTGFASLSMLKTYPLTRLKIDRGFVRDIITDRTDALIVAALASLGTGMGLDVIAEGIESEDQRALLHVGGCRSGQGYLFGRPMPAAQFERWMMQRGAVTPLEGARA